MLNESNKLSSDSTNLASRPTPETPPAAPTKLAVPAGKGKLHLGWSAHSGTVTNSDLFQGTVDAATATPGGIPDSYEGRFHARVATSLRRSVTRCLLLLSVSLRVPKLVVESIRRFPADYRASRQWLGALDQQIWEHYERKWAPRSDEATQEPAVFDPVDQFADCDVGDPATRLSVAGDERDETEF